MSDQILSKQVLVTIQENGIIRAPDGYLIARLNDDIPYSSAHLESGPYKCPFCKALWDNTDWGCHLCRCQKCGDDFTVDFEADKHGFCKECRK